MRARMYRRRWNAPAGKRPATMQLQAVFRPVRRCSCRARSSAPGTVVAPRSTPARHAHLRIRPEGAIRIRLPGTATGLARRRSSPRPAATGLPRGASSGRQCPVMARPHLPIAPETTRAPFGAPSIVNPCDRRPGRRAPVLPVPVRDLARHGLHGDRNAGDHVRRHAVAAGTPSTRSRSLLPKALS